MTVTENDVHYLSAVLVRNFVCVRADQVRESPNFVNFCLIPSIYFFLLLHKLKLILLSRQSNGMSYKNLDTSCYICLTEHFHRWCTFMQYFVTVLVLRQSVIWCSPLSAAVWFMLIVVRRRSHTAKCDSGLRVWRNPFLHVAQYEELSTCTSLLNHIPYVMLINW